ncbi:basic leucine zipper 34-like [Lycium ferocissimum]|uniref:basic leucine zipper 34-like n=1 Tax=Lycium ferocissimum TaxID=112874 RepID=UPI00281660BB|nr:basic leucine zipper 34-like [Lycium ferocissimum]
MDEKRKRSEPDLNLSLKSSVDQEEPSNKVLTLDEAIDFELKQGNVDPNVDLKKLRRTISNRLSAQRARNKRTEYIAELEKKVKDLEDKLAIMPPEIENERDKNNMLMLEGKMLREQLEIAHERSKLRTAYTEEMKLELRRLKELHEKARKEQHSAIHLLDIEGQGSNSYESESGGVIDLEQGIDHYLNLDAMNFYPPNYD